MFKKIKREEFDNSFYKLAEEVHKILEKNGNTKEKGLKSVEAQKKQVDRLMNAEVKFKKIILKYAFSTEIYKKFLQHICIKNRNILSAKPYFRESSKTFSKYITPAIKKNDIKELKKFNINYQFIKFIKENWIGPFPILADKYYNEVCTARMILIENNLPLAINRAKLFYRKTPKGRLTLMDLIVICTMGLATGVDKWCGPYSRVFRSVLIGRMGGNMIANYSETLLHFYPSDRRILYKANSIRGRKKIEDISELTTAVNSSFEEDKIQGKNVPKFVVQVGALSDLMNAASVVSAESSVNEEEINIYDNTQDSSVDIEGNLMNKEMLSRVLMLASRLPFLHKKILRLKGIKI